MTMLSIFEEEVEAKQDRTLDVRCASCSSMGTRMNGETCSACGGAGWLQLGNHPPPCEACNRPSRAQRPEPPGLPETYRRFYVEGHAHGKPPERPPYAIVDTFEEALERANSVLSDEFSGGGVVSITETLMDATSHVALDSWKRHESRR